MLQQEVLCPIGCNVPTCLDLRVVSEVCCTGVSKGKWSQREAAANFQGRASSVKGCNRGTRY